jgi:hypothetical protein
MAEVFDTRKGFSYRIYPSFQGVRKSQCGVRGGPKSAQRYEEVEWMGREEYQSTMYQDVRVSSLFFFFFFFFGFIVCIGFNPAAYAFPIFVTCIASAVCSLLFIGSHLLFFGR